MWLTGPDHGIVFEVVVMTMVRLADQTWNRELSASVTL